MLYPLSYEGLERTNLARRLERLEGGVSRR